MRVKVFMTIVWECQTCRTTHPAFPSIPCCEEEPVERRATLAQEDDDGVDVCDAWLGYPEPWPD
jgi:hypothetical protein